VPKKSRGRRSAGSVYAPLYRDPVETLAATGARTDFYVAVAGVVPILLITLLFQLRLFEIVRLRESFGLGLDLYLVITLGGLAITEVLALGRLWEGRSEDADGVVVFLSVTWALIQIAGIPVMRRASAILDHLTARLQPWVEMALTLGFIGVVNVAVLTSLDLGLLLPVVLLVLITAMVVAFMLGGSRGSRLPDLLDRLDEAADRRRDQGRPDTSSAAEPGAGTAGSSDPTS
jgi:hypothetical protein